jgi:hypothetical protein
VKVEDAHWAQILFLEDGDPVSEGHGGDLRDFTGSPPLKFAEFARALPIGPIGWIGRLLKDSIFDPLD